MSKEFEEWARRRPLRESFEGTITKKAWDHQQEKINKLQQQNQELREDKGDCELCHRIRETGCGKLIIKTSKENQELRERLEMVKSDSHKKSVNFLNLTRENQDLKAFIKEACEEIKTCPEGEMYHLKTLQFMNTDKYKEYTS